MVRRHINKVKRTYTRARGILGNSNIFQNPIAMGLMAGIAKNVINGQPPINVQSIQERITQPNAKNPIIPLVLGVVSHNTALKAIGTFLLVDPPIEEENNNLTQEEIDEITDTIIAEDEDEDEDEDEEENNEQQVYVHK